MMNARDSGFAQGSVIRLRALSQPVLYIYPVGPKPFCKFLLPSPVWSHEAAYNKKMVPGLLGVAATLHHKIYTEL